MDLNATVDLDDDSMRFEETVGRSAWRRIDLSGDSDPKAAPF
jgi:hypothetical protein